MQDDVLAELLEAVSAAGLDPRRWAEVPDILCRGFPGVKVGLLGDDRIGRPCVGGHVAGYEPWALPAYMDHYSAINPWKPFWAGAPVLTAFASEEHAPAHLIAETEFYRDWLEPVGEAECAVGVKFIDEPDAVALLTVHYGYRQVDVHQARLARMLGLVAPVFRSSICTNRAVGDERLRQASMEAVLDCLDAPAVAVDGRGKIRGTNRKAVALFEEARFLRERPSGHLSLADPVAARRLADAVALATAGLGGVVPRDADLLLPPGADTRGARISVAPVVLPEADRPGAWLYPPPRLALVLIRERSAPASLDPRSIEGLSGLTKAEARVAAEIAAGRTVAEAGRTLGISRETVRTHLKRIFEKTGCRRQAELVAFLARILGRT
ncbi:helix-turn-helix transcriptional regulator [Prosthecomicrobium sp. N25]|uniref:helix-turn-helix transcriptional regulator n=1 Tax=Prosthecomicrobium sp. N25 TaxID=3129254 RepID=UPI0030787677